MAKKKTNLSYEHLEDEDSKAPPVNGSSVRGLRQHLRCQELRSAAERSRAVSEAHPLLAESKVGDLHIPLSVQQQIVKL